MIRSRGLRDQCTGRKLTRPDSSVIVGASPLLQRRMVEQMRFGDVGGRPVANEDDAGHTLTTRNAGRELR